MLFQAQFAMAPTYAAPIVYRSQSSGSGSTVTKPSGVAVGDIVFLLVEATNVLDAPTSGGGAWSGVDTFGGAGTTGDPYNAWYWKELVTADLSGSWTKADTFSYLCVAYIGNGATT